MIRDPRQAMIPGIGAYGKYLAAFWQSLLKALWDAPVSYRREAHYMRGRGPKWREKNADGRDASR